MRKNLCLSGCVEITYLRRRLGVGASIGGPVVLRSGHVVLCMWQCVFGDSQVVLVKKVKTMSFCCDAEADVLLTVSE